MVRQFQADHGLVVDGIIGRKTTEAMRFAWGLTKAGLAHFLGQAHVETGGFVYVEENLNYRAERLVQVFKKYFTWDMALLFEYKPEAIANVVYAERMGNGDICSGDGYRYRGRGCMQLTGKYNYQKFADYISSIDVLLSPGLVSNKYFWRSGLFYFEMADIWNETHSVNIFTIKRVTKKVNGGTNGLKERDRWTRHYYSVQ